MDHHKAAMKWFRVSTIKTSLRILMMRKVSSVSMQSLSIINIFCSFATRSNLAIRKIRAARSSLPLLAALVLSPSLVALIIVNIQSGTLTNTSKTNQVRKYVTKMTNGSSTTIPPTKTPVMHDISMSTVQKTKQNHSMTAMNPPCSWPNADSGIMNISYASNSVAITSQLIRLRLPGEIIKRPTHPSARNVATSSSGSTSLVLASVATVGVACISIDLYVVGRATNSGNILKRIGFLTNFAWLCQAMNVNLFRNSGSRTFNVETNMLPFLRNTPCVAFPDIWHSKSPCTRSVNGRGVTGVTNSLSSNTSVSKLTARLALNPDRISFESLDIKALDSLVCCDVRDIVEE
mmetsp:Transcript_92531/g.145254  ORF Transcript_92531/g.145254 Transcript_92531/m.145254 type:complete len:348 (-) Transcript_92531:427-1470(-)